MCSGHVKQLFTDVRSQSKEAQRSENSRRSNEARERRLQLRANEARAQEHEAAQLKAQQDEKIAELMKALEANKIELQKAATEQKVTQKELEVKDNMQVSHISFDHLARLGMLSGGSVQQSKDHLKHWSVDKVQEFLAGLNIPNRDLFRRDAIDGQSLLVMNETDLTTSYQLSRVKAAVLLRNIDDRRH